MRGSGMRGSETPAGRPLGRAAYATCARAGLPHGKKAIRTWRTSPRDPCAGGQGFATRRCHDCALAHARCHRLVSRRAACALPARGRRAPMPVNRRNDNRLLHVQPDAPFEVVRAAYHALMARRHPDSGGDHEQAVLLNAAWKYWATPRAAANTTAVARTSMAPRCVRVARRRSLAPRHPGRLARRPPPGSAARCRGSRATTGVHCGSIGLANRWTFGCATCRWVA